MTGSSSYINFMSLFTYAVRPLSVEITSPVPVLEAGKAQQIQCRTSGANPPALVTWWVGNKQLIDAPNEVITRILFRFKRQNPRTLNSSGAVLRTVKLEAELTEFRGLIQFKRPEMRPSITRVTRCVRG